MSQFDAIQNQEPASSVASRIKAAFDHIFGAIASSAHSLWQELSGGRIKPKDDKSVYTPNLEVQNDVTLHSLKPDSGVRLLAINADGKIVSDQVHSPQESNWQQVPSSTLIKPKSPHTGIKTNLFLNFGEEGDVLAMGSSGQLSPLIGLKWNFAANSLQLPFSITSEDVLRPVMIDKDGIIRIETDLYSVSFYVHDGGPDHSLSGHVFIEGLTYGTSRFQEFTNSPMPQIVAENLPNDSYTLEIYARRHGTDLWHPPKFMHFEIDGGNADLGTIVLNPI